MTSPAVTYPELDNFNQEYKATAGRRAGLDALADGDYDFEILDASLDRTPTSGDLILRVGLRVKSAGQYQGLTVENVYFFRSQQNVDILGGDLCTLGFDADQWTPAAGRKFSVELPKVLPRMKGLCFRGTKKANVSEAKGKTYHNLFINGRLASTPMPAVAAEDNGEDESDSIPF